MVGFIHCPFSLIILKDKKQKVWMCLIPVDPYIPSITTWHFYLQLRGNRDEKNLAVLNHSLLHFIQKAQAQDCTPRYTQVWKGSIWLQVSTTFFWQKTEDPVWYFQVKWHCLRPKRVKNNYVFHGYTTIQRWDLILNYLSKLSLTSIKFTIWKVLSTMVA